MSSKWNNTDSSSWNSPQSDSWRPKNGRGRGRGRGYRGGGFDRSSIKEKKPHVHIPKPVSLPSMRSEQKSVTTPAIKTSTGADGEHAKKAWSREQKPFVPTSEAWADLAEEEDERQHQPDLHGDVRLYPDVNQYEDGHDYSYNEPYHNTRPPPSRHRTLYEPAPAFAPAPPMKETSVRPGQIQIAKRPKPLIDQKPKMVPKPKPEPEPIMTSVSTLDGRFQKLSAKNVIDNPRFGGPVFVPDHPSDVMVRNEEKREKKKWQKKEKKGEGVKIVKQNPKPSQKTAYGAAKAAKPKQKWAKKEK